MAVEGGGFEKCTEESAFAVAREASGSDLDTYVDGSGKWAARLTLKEVKFVAEYDSCLSYVVERYERWMHVSKKLENIKVAKDSYMASANAIERVDAHKAHIDWVTEGPKNNLDRRAIFCRQHLSTITITTGPLCQQWLPFVRGALSSARPHPYRFSCLMWHSVEHLEPMVDFWSVCAFLGTVTDRGFS